MGYIKIEDHARMLIEDNNYTLEWRIPKGDFQGKKGIGFTWQLGGYFQSLDALLKDYVINRPSHLKPSETAARNLNEVVKCIQEAEKRIEKLIHNK
jgi:hypothetical protein